VLSDSTPGDAIRRQSQFTAEAMLRYEHQTSVSRKLNKSAEIPDKPIAHLTDRYAPKRRQ
jgi:hypothetical protein